MKKSEMQITIGQDGQVNIEVQGVGGAACLKFSEFLEEELGYVINRQKTSEYYEQEDEEKVELKLGGN
jgi:hypothetical protein